MLIMAVLPRVTHTATIACVSLPRYVLFDWLKDASFTAEERAAPKDLHSGVNEPDE